MSHTKFNLQRFLDAQEGVYPVALKKSEMEVSAAVDLVYLPSAEGAGL